MDFDFSEEQYMVRESVRALLAETLGSGKITSLVEGETPDTGLWRRFAEIGIFSMLVPQAEGGLGLTVVDLALVIEECGRALAPPSIIEALVASDVLIRYATETQKARLCPRLVEGALRIAPALAEKEAGFDPGGVTLTAEPASSGWRVTGRKLMVPFAASADFLLVALRFSRAGPLGLALVERDRAGIVARQHTTLDPAARFHEVTFDRVDITREDVIGGDPVPDAAYRLFDAGAMAAALAMTGIAARVLDDAVAYAAQRMQFGRPIGSFQAIKHRCADIAVAVEASRSAAYYAAWALAEDVADRARAVSMAKSYCGDASRFACNEAIQLHGGIGFTWELGLHFYLRRAKTLEYIYGDAAWHRERVLAETLASLRSPVGSPLPAREAVHV